MRALPERHEEGLLLRNHDACNAVCFFTISIRLAGRRGAIVRGVGVGRLADPLLRLRNPLSRHFPPLPLLSSPFLLPSSPPRQSFINETCCSRNEIGERVYPITRFNSWQMQLCVIAGPVSCPRKCGGVISRNGRTERDERDESSSFFFLLFFLFPFRASLISFPFLFLFFILFYFLPFLFSVGFLASVYIQVYNNVR